MFFVFKLGVEVAAAHDPVWKSWGGNAGFPVCASLIALTGCLFTYGISVSAVTVQGRSGESAESR